MTGYVRKDTSNNIADGNIINAADLDAEFDGVVDAFNASTGHKHDGTTGEGAPITVVGPTQDVTVSATAITPKTTNTVDIGSSSLKFKDLFITGTATLPTVSATTVGATTGNITTVNATTVDTTNIEVTNIKAKDGTSSATIADSTGVMTIASSILTTADINGGTIDGTTIGGATPAAGAFTTLSTTGALTYGGVTLSNAVTGTGNMVLSNSPTLTTPNLGTPSAIVLTNASGTASININGTVGATTPTTGAFTTLTTSSTVTHNGGTANGVAYLNGSKVLTSGSALTFDGTTFRTLSGAVASGGSVNGSFRLDRSDGATNLGAISWVTAGDEFRFDNNNGGFFNWRINSGDQMRLTSTGLGIGTSSPVQKLHVNGNIAVQGSSFPAIKWYNGAGTNVAELYFGAGGGNDLNIVNYQAGPLVFKTNNTTQATLDSSGNLGLGVTPSAWATYKSIDLPAGGYVSSGGDWMEVMMNTYYNGGYKYKYNGYASHYLQQSGVHSWYTAPSGTAGNAISFTQAMTLDAIGRLGIGTTSPLARLHVSDAGASGVEVSPVGGYISGAYIQAYNRSTSAYIPLELNGSTIAFFNNNAERARIDSSGNLLVGTTSALATNTHSFVAAGASTGAPMAARNSGASAGKYWTFGPDTSNNYRVFNQGGTGMYMVDGATSWTANSDERLKTALKPFENAASKVCSLRAGTGRYLTDDETVSRSFLIAQDVRAVLPEAVNVQQDEIGTLGLQYTDVIPLLVAAIQDQQATILAQQTALETLTQRIAVLEGASKGGEAA